MDFQHPLIRARQVALRHWLMAIDECGNGEEAEKLLLTKRRLDDEIRYRLKGGNHADVNY